MHFRCDNGKEYIIKDLPNGKWALMSVRNGKEITSFLTTQDYVRGRLEDEGCSNDLGLSDSRHAARREGAR
jgi:hypothetical protein